MIFWFFTMNFKIEGTKTHKTYMKALAKIDLK